MEQNSLHRGKSFWLNEVSNQAFLGRRACRSFEPSESRRESDGVSNPRQACTAPSAVGCAAGHPKTRAILTAQLSPMTFASARSITRPLSSSVRDDLPRGAYFPQTAIAFCGGENGHSRLRCTSGTDGESLRAAKQLAIRYGSTRIQAARLAAESLNGSGASCFRNQM